VGRGLGVGVGRGVGVGVAVGVGVGETVGDGVGDAHGTNRATSSTYIPVSSPKAFWCTRNLMRTVCPAYGAMSTSWLIQVLPFSHWWKIVSRMLPLASVI